MMTLAANLQAQSSCRRFGSLSAPISHRVSSRSVACKTEVVVRATAAAESGGYEGGGYALSDAQRTSMINSSLSLRRWGWVSFWIQLALTLTSSVILLFSMAFSSATGPRISLFMTIFGVLAQFFSTFWTFGYTRLSRKLMQYADAVEGTDIQRISIRKKDVKKTLRNGLTINVIGMGAALLGLQAMVGMLMAKTLNSASANPFFHSTASSQMNPSTALDVFLVQAATNTLLSHFFSLVVCFYLLRAVDQ